MLSNIKNTLKTCFLSRKDISETIKASASTIYIFSQKVCKISSQKGALGLPHRDIIKLDHLLEEFIIYHPSNLSKTWGP